MQQERDGWQPHDVPDGTTIDAPRWPNIRNVLGAMTLRADYIDDDGSLSAQGVLTLLAASGVAGGASIRSLTDMGRAQDWRHWQWLAALEPLMSELEARIDIFGFTAQPGSGGVALTMHARARALKPGDDPWMSSQDISAAFQHAEATRLVLTEQGQEGRGIPRLLERYVAPPYTIREPRMGWQTPSWPPQPPGRGGTTRHRNAPPDARAGPDPLLHYDVGRATDRLANDHFDIGLMTTAHRPGAVAYANTLAGAIPGTQQPAANWERVELGRAVRGPAPRGTTSTASGIRTMEEHLRAPGGLVAHLFALRRDSENTSERVIRRLVHAPGMPATYHFTEHDERWRHGCTLNLDRGTGGLVMTAPNGTNHEDARLYGGGEGPKHWFKVRPLESPRDHWEMRHTDDSGGRTTTAATDGWPHDGPQRRPRSHPYGNGGADPRAQGGRPAAAATAGETTSDRPTEAATARAGNQRRRNAHDETTATPRPKRRG